MDLTRMSLPDSASSYLLLDFPGPGGQGAATLPEAGVLPGADALPGAAEPKALLSLREAGDLRYRHEDGNPLRVNFFEGCGISSSRVLGTKLAHSRSILFPSDAAQQRRLVDEAIVERGGADGVITREPSLVPTVTAADCMPIWILDRHSGAFGVLHSGWRGTGILKIAVEELGRRFGSPPSSLSAILGPAIGSCCYDVPEERAELFLERYGERAAFREGGTWRIDLREANIALAGSSGLGWLLSVDACTSCDPRLGSYRREGPASFTCMAAACGNFRPPEACRP
ncbi:MAG TPA: polyphenol oxidase family protein [Rectinemataceae bacterium]|nr:polyphenol oxidase family protein [Rectinemataceae bacterium]